MISINLPKIFSNDFYKLFHLKYPIIQAPMAGGASSPNLVAAVANEGILGFLAAGYLSTEIFEKQIIETKAKTNTIFGVNLFIIDPLIQNNFIKPENICAIEKELGIFKTKKIKIHIDEEIENKIDIIIKHNVKVVSFTFGLPNKKLIEKLKKHNIYTIGSSTNIIEAKIIEDLGLDAVVAQGIEAGGHRASFLNHNLRDEIGLISLLQEFQGLIQIPVIASGGIITGKSLLAVQTLGAASSQIGTGFLLTEESGIPKSYKETLLNCHSHETVLTEYISGKKARGKFNLLIENLHSKKIKKAEFPIQNSMTKDIRAFASKNENPDFMSLWCGQSVWKIKKIISAKQFIFNIMAEYQEEIDKIKKL